MSDEHRLRDAWARLDAAKAREIKAHERAIWFHQKAAVRFDRLADEDAAIAARAHAATEWHRLQAANRDLGKAVAARTAT